LSSPTNPPLTPERRGARERLDSLIGRVTGSTDSEASRLVRELTPQIESEAVDRRLAELREAVEGLPLANIGQWANRKRGVKFLDRAAVLALMTSDEPKARDRSPE